MAKGVKKVAFRFELSWGGLFSLVIVCGCIFLWMFLLGVWAGQTILLPSEGSNPLSFERLTGKAPASPVKEKSASDSAPVPSPAVTAAEPVPAAPHEQSFFVLQVGAFRDAEYANHAKAEWEAKGYKAFVQPAAENSDGMARVFIGKFEKLSDANVLATKLDNEEGVQAYIALLPASQIHLP